MICNDQFIATFLLSVVVTEFEILPILIFGEDIDEIMRSPFLTHGVKIANEKAIYLCS